MSSIQKISLTQYRNYSFANFSFSQRITCITGANGCGKTNLLDAVYYLCYTKSYFTAQQLQLVQKGTEGFRIEGVFAGSTKNETITCKWRDGKKEFSADGNEYERITEHIGKYAAVMIAPDDLELINDGSELRRKWIDGILCQTDRTYFDLLIQYQKTLLQRNAWLKMEAVQPTVNSHALDYYNQQLAGCGQYIFEQRSRFITDFLPLLNDFYSRLSSGKEQVALYYQSDLQEQPLMVHLQQQLQNDLRLQRTTRGIHKDDLQFMTGDFPVKNFGSQGQKKSYLFALKLAQYTYLSKHQRQLPVLLLDDIFEKLDQSRIEALMQIIKSEGFGQVIITDTHEERVKSAFGKETMINVITLL